MGKILSFFQDVSAILEPHLPLGHTRKHFSVSLSGLNSLASPLLGTWKKTQVSKVIGDSDDQTLWLLWKNF